MSAELQGRLVAHEDWGVALAVENSVVKVTWPYGYQARTDGDRLSLVDGGGRVLAHVGDYVQIGGGFTGDDDWYACGDVAILPGQQTPQPTPPVARPSSPAEATPPVPGAAGWVGPTRIATEQYELARLVVDADGHAHVAAVNNNGIFYLTNATGTWTTEQVSTPIDDGYDGDPSIIVNEEGSATIAFARYSALRCTLRCGPVGSQGIFMVTNDAGSWSDPVAVIEGGGQEPSLQAAADRLHLAYSRGEFGERSVFFASRENAEWVATEIGEGEAPSLRVGRDGLPRVAYVDRQGRPSLAETESAAGRFTITRLPGEWTARSALLVIDADDEPHVVFGNDANQSDPFCGALHLERTKARWTDVVPVFPRDEFCQIIPESVDGDASGALHVISLYNASGAGVWYANNTAGDFRARQLREPKMFTDDGPRGVSALDVDHQGRPHIIFGVFEAGAYDEDTEGSREDDGLWYGIGPPATVPQPSDALEPTPHGSPFSTGGLAGDLVGRFGMAPGGGSGYDIEGCPVLVSEGAIFLVQYPEGWTMRAGIDGIELVAPTGEIYAREGDLVAVDGVRGGEGNFSCVGTVFRADAVSGVHRFD
jgi:hypothetical protein